MQSFSPVLSTARNVVLFLGRPFRWSATQNVIAFVRLDLHVRDEGEHEFDQLIHASFSSLFQLEKALEADQSLVYFGAELDATIEASLFPVIRHRGHHFFLVEVYHNPSYFLPIPPVVDPLNADSLFLPPILMPVNSLQLLLADFSWIFLLAIPVLIYRLAAKYGVRTPSRFRQTSE